MDRCVGTGTGRWQKEEAETDDVYCTGRQSIYVCDIHMNTGEE